MIETASKTLVAGCKTSVIPDDGSVTSVFSAFENCTGLTSIAIPRGVEQISGFNGCTSLKDIAIGDGARVIYGFKGCVSLENIELPDSVTTIVQETFCGCSSLKSIEIPDSVTTIEQSAFYGCSSLKSIEIPILVSYIDANTFSHCSSLETVTFDNLNLQWIGDAAFEGCVNLTEIYYCGTKAQWEWIQKGNHWMLGINKLTVYCTDGEIIY